jgi:hypothetical protein
MSGIPITDPVELAWCEFARRREEKAWPGPIRPGEQGLSIASFKAGAEWERGVCAELVRAADCGCGGGHGPDRDDDDVFVNEAAGWHAGWCPIAISAKIEARGATDGRAVASRRVAAKLSALLDSEEPPEGLVDALAVWTEEGWDRKARREEMEAAWRWFREQAVEP